MLNIQDFVRLSRHLRSAAIALMETDEKAGFALLTEEVRENARKQRRHSVTQANSLRTAHTAA